MKSIRKYFLPVLLVIALVAWGYFQFTKKGPCEVPIKYALGTLDSRFGISKTDFINSIEDASQVWENSYGKNLFEYDAKYDPKAKTNIFEEYIGKYFTRQDVVVSLVYDDRQKLADKNRVLSSSIDDTKVSADAIKQEFMAIQNDYKTKSAEYESMLAEYKQNRGRGSVSYDALESKRLEVNALADAVNALVKKYNFLVTSINTTVTTINKSAGKEFEEGQYVSDANGERINIFEFGNRDILVRVLANEFGHVLNLDHNDNPSSIMYYLNSSTNIKPTKEDIAALKAVCATK